MDVDQPSRISLVGGFCHHPGLWHKCQSYYLMGLRQIPGLRLGYTSAIDRGFAWARERGWQGSSRTWHYLARRNPDGRYEEATHVGRYFLHFSTRADPLRVAVDVHDIRKIRDPKAYDWAEVYFKVNHWAGLDYGPKARPLVTGNGALNQARLNHLIALRDHPKHLDLVLIAKLWPSAPGPTYWNPVEHLVRVFEALAGLKCRSLLWAIVPDMKGKEFPSHYLNRLDKCGILVTKTNVTINELWAATSAARLAFLRPGKHLCVSWRMIDHLAMGACTVCDRAPYAQWPVPLQSGRELFDCECGIGQDEALPEPGDYERIAEGVRALLADPERAAAIRVAAANYFDRYVAPEKIARYMIEIAAQALRLSAPSAPNQPPAGVARAAAMGRN